MIGAVCNVLNKTLWWFFVNLWAPIFLWYFYLTLKSVLNNFISWANFRLKATFYFDNLLKAFFNSAQIITTMAARWRLCDKILCFQFKPLNFQIWLLSSIKQFTGVYDKLFFVNHFASFRVFTFRKAVQIYFLIKNLNFGFLFLFLLHKIFKFVIQQIYQFCAFFH